MKHAEDTSALWSIGTAVPSYRIDQTEMLKLLLDYHQPPADLARILKFIYRRSQIESLPITSYDRHG